MRKNQETADFLDSLKLSDRARNIIAQTDINMMAECFGGLETAEEVEDYIRENYPDDEEYRKAWSYSWAFFFADLQI